MNTDQSTKMTPQEPFCFVLIPQTRAYLNLWDAVIRPAIENSGMEALRREDVAQRYDNIMEGVRAHIINADVIIAVVTGEDATVMYDLGLAHAAKKKVVMMLEQDKQPPANFSNSRILSYDPTDFPRGREELTQWLQSARGTQSEDLFPELPIRSRQELDEYEYLKQIRKTLTIKVTPKNCSIFFNNRLLGTSPQTIHVNPDAERNVLSISATEHFEHYQVLTEEDLEEGVLQVTMEPRDKAKYPERVNAWLMRRREDPDNPVLSRAIANYLWDQGDYGVAREEAHFCVSKAPEWFAGYNVIGNVELNAGNYEKAKAHFQTVARLSPNDWLAPFCTACVDSLIGNYPAALERLGEIIASSQLSESYRQAFYRQDRRRVYSPADESDFEPLRNHPQYKDRFSDIARQFDEITAAPEPALIEETSPDIQPDEETQPLPYTLKQLQIANFQCINSTGVSEIPVDCPWIFLTGENGVGKTSLLQALTIGLYGVEGDAHLPAGGDDDCKIDVEIQEDGTSHLRHFYWDSDHWKTVHPQDKNREALEPARNILAYGTSRLFVLDGNRMANQKTQISPVASLLSPGGDLYNIEYWFQMQTLEATDGESKDFTILSRIETVKTLLISLMPHVTDIELRGSQVSYKEKGHPVPFDHLAASHKSIVAMIGDMLIRLFESQPDVTAPKELQGIVLIDELENHLHPKWQVEFPKLLSETFPKVQFIASTHSVLPFLGAPKGSVFLKVSRGETEGTTVERLDIDVANLLPNSLLTSPLFDLDSILSKQNEDFGSLHTDDDYEEILRQMERDKRLDKYAQEGTGFLKELLAQDGENS